MKHYNVEPLRSDQEIAELLNILERTRNGPRNRMIVLLGINTGLRMSDILHLQVGQVRNKRRVQITEIKTQKKRWVYLGNLANELQIYTKHMADDDPLFAGNHAQYLTVNGVYRIFQRAGMELGRTDLGTHTLRKTFGYHYYRQTHDIATLMIIFNHSSEQVTKRYIGIERDTIENQLENFQLGF